MFGCECGRSDQVSYRDTLLLAANRSGRRTRAKAAGRGDERDENGFAGRPIVAAGVDEVNPNQVFHVI